MSTTWIEDIRTWRAPDLQDDGVGLLSATLDEVLGGTGGRVGLPAGHETNLRMPLQDFWALQALRPERSFVSDGDIVRSARSIGRSKYWRKKARVLWQTWMPQRR